MINKDKIGSNVFAAIAFAVLVLFLSISIVGKSVARRVHIPSPIVNTTQKSQAALYPYEPIYVTKHYTSLQKKKKVVRDYDQDDDGVLDRDDICPDLPGPASTNGCPDSDGDGVADYEDECPDLPGLKIFDGCPDTDGDSIPDNKDVCPQEKGPASNNGCPVVAAPGEPVAKVMQQEEIKLDASSANQVDYSIPQGNIFSTTDAIYYTENRIILPPVKEDTSPRRDAVKTTPPITPSIIHNPQQLPLVDSLRNSQEKSLIAAPFVKLISVKKSISDADMRILQRILAKVSFEKGRIIMGKDTRDALDELADLMKKNQDWHVKVSSYAAEADNSYRNLRLSQNRVDAIRSHLIKKQIPSSRIDRKGYGSQFAPSDTTCLSHIDFEID